MQVESQFIQLSSTMHSRIPGADCSSDVNEGKMIPHTHSRSLFYRKKKQFLLWDSSATVIVVLLILLRNFYCLT